jgi:hypothetical protein
LEEEKEDGKNSTDNLAVSLAINVGYMGIPFWWTVLQTEWINRVRRLITNRDHHHGDKHKNQIFEIKAFLIFFLKIFFRVTTCYYFLIKQ